MVGIASNSSSKVVLILGHGLEIPEEMELVSGIYLTPDIPKIDLDEVVKGVQGFSDYAAVVQGSEIASFGLRIEHKAGGKELTVRAWNALWLFHHMSVACESPCFSLYSVCDGDAALFSGANPSPFVRPLDRIHTATPSQLEWACRYAPKFDELIQIPEFSAAMRCYSNAHRLPEPDVRIMLLWAGIEGLLSVDAELSRRLALYAALLKNGTPEEMIAYFNEVKKAYGVRSRAVHGSGLKQAQLESGCQTAGKILIGLLAKCVEIGRVPSASELDGLAVMPIVS